MSGGSCVYYTCMNFSMSLVWYLCMCMCTSILIIFYLMICFIYLFIYLFIFTCFVCVRACCGWYALFDDNDVVYVSLLEKSNGPMKIKRPALAGAKIKLSKKNQLSSANKRQAQANKQTEEKNREQTKGKKM